MSELAERIARDEKRRAETDWSLIRERRNLAALDLELDEVDDRLVGSSREAGSLQERRVHSEAAFNHATTRLNSLRSEISGVISDRGFLAFTGALTARVSAIRRRTMAPADVGGIWTRISVDVEEFQVERISLARALDRQMSELAMTRAEVVEREEELDEISRTMERFPSEGVSSLEKHRREVSRKRDSTTLKIGGLVHDLERIDRDLALMHVQREKTDTETSIGRANDKDDLFVLLTDLGPFGNYYDVLVFAAVFGWHERLRVSLRAKGEPIPREVANRLLDTGNLSKMIAAAETGDAEIVAPDRFEERLQIFEEYANGGLEVLRGILEREQRAPLDVILGLVHEFCRRSTVDRADS